jgi:hypothetical protein
MSLGRKLILILPPENAEKKLKPSPSHALAMTALMILGRRIAFFLAALMAASGVFLILAGFELSGRSSPDVPGWVIMLCGLACLSAAGSMAPGLIAGVTPRDGSLPNSASLPLRLVQTLLSLGVMVLLSFVAAWVAFNPGDTAGTGYRLAFSAGVALCWLISLGFTIRAIRRLRG